MPITYFSSTPRSRRHRQSSPDQSEPQPFFSSTREQTKTAKAAFFPPAIQRLATPDEEKMPGTNDQRMLEDKMIQEKSLSRHTAQPEKEEMVQGKAETGNSPNVASSKISGQIQNSQGRGEALPEGTRTEMESAIGADFSQVKVHTNSESVALNQALGAQAFTHGNDVYFNSGRYQPESSEGRRLLAHELTHVVQQSGTVQRKGLAISPAPTASILQLCRLKSGPAYSDLSIEITNRPGAKPDEEPGEVANNNADAEADDSSEVKSEDLDAMIAALSAPAAGQQSSGRAHFYLDAEFEKGEDDNCDKCETRQMIKWDEAAAQSFGDDRRPHEGFEKDEGLDTWVEDQGLKGKRYGHRDEPFRGNSYPKNCEYQGEDNPQTHPAEGKWWFQLSAIKKEADGKETLLGKPDYLTINWSAGTINKGIE